MNRTTEQRLSEHFAQGTTDIAGSGVEAVMERGRRIGRNRTIAVGVGAFALVAVLVAGAAAFQSALERDDSPVADEISDTPLSGGELSWVAVSSEVGNARATTVGTDLYVLSTAPGVRGNVPPGEAQQAIYVSSDGEAWTPQLLGGDLWVQDLDAAGDLLYAIGTSPGVTADRTIDATVGVTDDGGAEWSYLSLPSVAKPVGGLPMDGSHVSTSLAVGEGVVVAAVTTQFNIDLTPLIPADLRGPDVGVESTENGIRAVDYRAVEQAMSECGGNDECFRTIESDPGTVMGGLVFEATWDELGIEEGGSLFSELFVSEDGAEFERVEAPVAGSQLTLYPLGELGFAASGYTSTGGYGVWTSPDGRTWSETTLGAVGYIGTVGEVDGNIVVLAQSSGDHVVGENPLVVMSAADPARAWTTHEVSDLLPPIGRDGERYMSAADVGDAGVAFSVESYDGDVTQTSVVYSSDLSSWSVLPMSDLLGQRPGYVEGIAVDSDQMFVRITSPPENGIGDPLHLTAIGTPKG